MCVGPWRGVATPCCSPGGAWSLIHSNKPAELLLLNLFVTAVSGSTLHHISLWLLCIKHTKWTEPEPGQED